MNIVQYESCCQVARSLEVRIHEAELALRRQVAKLSFDSRRLGSNKKLLVKRAFQVQKGFNQFQLDLIHFSRKG